MSYKTLELILNHASHGKVYVSDRRWMYCFYFDAFYFRLLIHDPDQRLGANGASEVVIDFLYLSTLSFKQISLAVKVGNLKVGAL